MTNSLAGTLFRSVKSTVVAVAVLGGCSTIDYSRTPTARLCLDYLSNPSYNVAQPSREKELAARGEDCRAYAGPAAAIRAQRDAAALEAGTRLLTTPPPVTNCITSYVGNQAVTTCR